MIRAVLILALLTLIYALVLASFAPADLLTGLLLSALLLLMARGYVFQDGAGRSEESRPFLRRALALFPFAWAFLKQTASGTWLVLRVVFRLKPLHEAGIVAVPMGERTRLGVVVTAFVATFAPGSYVVDLNWERREMVFHVLNATNPDEIRASYEDFYRRYQKPIFP